MNTRLTIKPEKLVKREVIHLYQGEVHSKSKSWQKQKPRSLQNTAHLSGRVAWE